MSGMPFSQDLWTCLLSFLTYLCLTFAAIHSSVLAFPVFVPFLQFHIRFNSIISPISSRSPPSAYTVTAFASDGFLVLSARTQHGSSNSPHVHFSTVAARYRIQFLERFFNSLLLFFNRLLLFLDLLLFLICLEGLLGFVGTPFRR